MWPREVLHGDHQLMSADAARPLCRATDDGPSDAVTSRNGGFPLCCLFVTAKVYAEVSSLKTSAIALHAVVFGVHEAPCSTGKSLKDSNWSD